MVDKDDAVPVTIHKDSCSYYTGRKPDATTIVWCQADTLEDAEVLAGRLAKSHGTKLADCCLAATDRAIKNPPGRGYVS